jgi:hypothetical protein
MRRLVTSLTLFTAVVVGGVAAASVAAVGAPADETQPSLVETYSYPGAEQILAEKGIKLIKGDGHIVLAECVSGTGQAEVWSRSKGHICFEARGAAGLLTMEIPEAYLILGAGGHTIQATVVIDGVTSSVTVLKNEFRGIGESGPGGKPAVLLELRTVAA